jgi:RNA methyltransferase, TrmH family
VISKNKIKLIKSLENKKYRDIHQLFLAEGNKIVTDLLHSKVEVRTLIGTSEFLTKTENLIKHGSEVIESNHAGIKSASLLQNPQEAIALCQIPSYNLDDADPSIQLLICLDNIQDPGNLGTIIRVSDWFGIENVVCSSGMADIFNPKAVQASMGSIGRVKVHYTALDKFLSAASGKRVSIIGAYLDGENAFTTDLPEAGILMMGNEGRGISEDLTGYISKKIRIPSFSKSAEHAESLNVATATAILCAEFRRRSISL